MVGVRHDERALLPRHLQDPARKLKIGGSRRGDERDGGENDV